MAIPPKKSKIPHTIFGRTTKLLGAATLMVGREIVKEVSGRLSDVPAAAALATRVKQAQDLVETLGNLRGAAMKVGQLLSLELSDLLPKEVVEILRTLHDQATHLPFEEIESILKAELGEKKFSQLKELSKFPIAAASIGQVHRAILDGKQVVLKIQYPGVADSIESDISMLQKIVIGMLTVQGKSFDLKGVFAELTEGLKLEADYVREASSLRMYKDAFKGHHDLVIPEVFEDFSTKKVLTMTFEEGVRLSDWISGDLTDLQRNDFGKLVLGLLAKEFFELGIVQTDPNYGNFLIQEDGKRLVLLDFGAVRTYEKDFRTDIKGLLDAAIRRDQAAVLRMSDKMSLLDPRESQKIREDYLAMLDLIASMFRPECQPFSFADETFLKNIRTTSIAFAQNVQYTTPAKQLLFVNRKLGGMYHLLKDAKCTLDVAELWEGVRG